MTHHERDLRLRRQQLLVRIAMQRLELAQAMDAWARPLQVADGVMAVAGYARAHPLLLAGVAAWLARRRREGGWLRWGWRLWRLYRGVKSAL